MSLRAVFSACVLLISTWAALPAQAQYVYYRRPAPRRVVVVRPAPRPVVVAPVVVLPARPVAYAPAPVLVRPRPVVVVRPRRLGYYRY